jgi:cobalt-precorrin-5B (C1)-methyltransferase
MASTGYTLPVFAVAAAKAALLHLQGQSDNTVTLNILPGTVQIPIEQLAKLGSVQALAITRSDPGDNLDLTHNMPLWAKVELQTRGDVPLILAGGEGLGQSLEGSPAIYSYARRLFDANLLPLINNEYTVVVTIILPEGKQLASRTSNAAFGIIEGLSLLGTSGISQPLSNEKYLNNLRKSLIDRAQRHKKLVFCIGSNGMQVADRAGIDPQKIVQTGNWIGAMLLEAALQNVESVLLLGYQGKLIKLAGGIFNTSSHLADAKLEILSGAMLRAGANAQEARQVLAAKTADEAHQIIFELGWEVRVFGYLVDRINARSMAYVQKYVDRPLLIETVLFDRRGQIIVGTEKLANML